MFRASFRRHSRRRAGLPSSPSALVRAAHEGRRQMARPRASPNQTAKYPVRLRDARKRTALSCLHDANLPSPSGTEPGAPTGRMDEGLPIKKITAAFASSEGAMDSALMPLFFSTAGSKAGTSSTLSPAAICHFGRIPTSCLSCRPATSAVTSELHFSKLGVRGGESGVNINLDQ